MSYTDRSAPSFAAIGERFRRALRSESGTTFQLHELRAMADIGILDALAQAEIKELRATWAPTAAESELPAASLETPEQAYTRAIYTPEQLASLWDVPRPAIMNAIKSGALPSFKIGTRLYRVRRDEAIKFGSALGSRKADKA